MNETLKSITNYFNKETNRVISNLTIPEYVVEKEEK